MLINVEFKDGTSTIVKIDESKLGDDPYLRDKHVNIVKLLEALKESLGDEVFAQIEETFQVDEECYRMSKQALRSVEEALKELPGDITLDKEIECFKISNGSFDEVYALNFAPIYLERRPVVNINNEFDFNIDGSNKEEFFDYLGFNEEHEEDIEEIEI